MLTVTESAAEMIARLTDQAQLPGGGLRIAHEGEHPGLTMSVVQRPAADDLVLREHQVAVFLDPVAASRLRSQTLDARSNDEGAAFFLEP